MKVGLLPLDSRPCNYSNLAEMAEFSGIRLSLPSRNLIHSLFPHDHQAQSRWLGSALRDGADAVVVSVDQWIYGGLVRSRKLEISPEEAKQRLSELVQLRLAFPKVKFFLFSTLLRLTVTVNATQSELLWKSVFRFSVLKGKSVLTDLEKSELSKLESDIPERVLKEYLAVRDRNFSVNSILLGQAEKFDGIMYGQEDCAEDGLHQREKRDLELIRKTLPTEVQKRTIILTGADELGMQSLMRAFQVFVLKEESPLLIPIFTVDPAIYERVSVYEDISVRKNLTLHFEYSPFRFEPTARIEDSQLVIHPFPSSGQSDHLFPDFAPLKEQDLSWVSKLDNQGVLDLEIGNGASPALWKTLNANGKLLKLSSFSAWNTTGNRTGGLIAHLGLKEVAKRSRTFNLESERKYFKTRLLDDGVYQAFVRKKLWTRCQEKGLNPWALAEHTPEFEQELNRLMAEVSAEFGIDTSKFKFSLPWNRLFEVEVIHPV